MADDLSRFVRAQAGSYDGALAELRRGAKRQHWMWWIFPQIAGLGRSDTARHYAIASGDEARAYLAHPVLGPRLIEVTEAVAAAPGTAVDIMSAIDAMKLRSSMTLFEAVAVDKRSFAAVLDRLFAGERDGETLARL
ncbi:DUF1810 domain-containing protein [Sphingomonas sp. 1P08PE]|uniref:DUF1810 domain-containing protein n=1 Tax=Sphingomonas sp. 1P08PE TaxID=554122 RepID=UPI0039A18CF3